MQKANVKVGTDGREKSGHEKRGQLKMDQINSFK